MDRNFFLLKIIQNMGLAIIVVLLGRQIFQPHIPRFWKIVFVVCYVGVFATGNTWFIYDYRREKEREIILKAQESIARQQAIDDVTSFIDVTLASLGMNYYVHCAVSRENTWHPTGDSAFENFFHPEFISQIENNSELQEKFFSIVSKFDHARTFDVQTDTTIIETKDAIFYIGPYANQRLMVLRFILKSPSE